ncbi:MAG: DUF1552 domain-containing protein [Polyangiaceae bacterium]|nr:DUF1552 domain-containing protein [Polyangiaceae bacterium]
MSGKLNRRAVLRGVGGLAVSLPVLECMLNQHGTALAQGAALPKRYGIIFAGQAIGGDGWAKDNYILKGVRTTEAGHFIVPPEAGAGYSITTPLMPLAALKGDVSVLSGLQIPFDKNSTEGAAVPPGGAYRDFHGGGASPLLCGTRSTTSSFRAASITSDQVVAGLSTVPVRSLVYRAQPSWYLSGSSFSGRQYISYDANGAIEAQVSPQVAYQSLFANFTPMGGQAQAAQVFDQLARKSVLDSILVKSDPLLQRVSAADRVRLARHFDELRALEVRIAAGPMENSGQCQVPAQPPADPATGQDNAGADAASISSTTGYSDEHTRSRLLADLIHMAFVCDITRVATLQVTVFQSHMNVYEITRALGNPMLADLHEVGHNGDPDNKGQLPVSMCLQWHVSHYAYLLDKLKNTPEGAGNVLDNSAIVFMPEAGHGLQLNDGVSVDQTHSVDQMVLLVAGRAGGLKAGVHLPTAGRHPASVLISAMRAVGYSGDSLGEVTGGISEMFA